MRARDASEFRGDFPADIKRFLLDAPEVEFATLTAKGAPINNPLFFYFGGDGRTIDVATGVAYPAKAERARRSPSVGMLFAPSIAANDPIVRKDKFTANAFPPGSDGPVLIIGAKAAVRDEDIQANTDRYMREFTRDHPLLFGSWEQERERVHYFARIWIQCLPVKLLWWPNGIATGEQPIYWRAPPNYAVPSSDPTPPGRRTPSTDWPVLDWREAARKVLDMTPLPTLTLRDDEGFPMPFPTLGAALEEEGFTLKLSGSLPWVPKGPACLTFSINATFLGRVTSVDTTAHFVVDRLLGNLPNDKAPTTSLESIEAIKTRMREELHRRGQPIPKVRLT
jgi:hypothetical protein